MRLLLDTDVLLDYYLRRRPFFKSAATLRVAQAYGDVDLWACAQSFSDAEYVMRKLAPLEDVRAAMAESLRFLRVCSTVAEDVAPGLASGWGELEDCLIARAAERIEADYLVTRDARGFGRSPVPAIAPDDLVDLLRREYGLEYEEVGRLAERGE